MTASTRALNPSTVWSVPEAFRPIYSHATELTAGTKLLFVSGQFGIAPDGKLPEAFGAQTRLAMANVEALLAGSGMSKADLVKLTFFLTRSTDAPELAAIRRELWSAAEPPAVTAIVVTALAKPEYLIEIEAIGAA